MTDRSWAHGHMTTLLAEDQGRMAHSLAVASRASSLATDLLSDPEERSVLVAAALLHDIGYAPSLVVTGCHHLDGACHLEGLGEHRLACLVAHHGSGAAEAALRGLSDQFEDFPHEFSPIADILTYCDLTSAPNGGRVSVDERLREIRARYGDGDVVVRGLAASDSLIRNACTRVEGLIASSSETALRR
ncbi:MAG: HD domain-containing protein [Acidimicrobiales bacterium]|jgi:hypothetical protein